MQRFCRGPSTPQRVLADDDVRVPAAARAVRPSARRSGADHGDGLPPGLRRGPPRHPKRCTGRGSSSPSSGGGLMHSDDRTMSASPLRARSRGLSGSLFMTMPEMAAQAVADVGQQANQHAHLAVLRGQYLRRYGVSADGAVPDAVSRPTEAPRRARGAGRGPLAGRAAPARRSGPGLRRDVGGVHDRAAAPAVGRRRPVGRVLRRRARPCPPRRPIQRCTVRRMNKLSRPPVISLSPLLRLLPQG
ncbi:hypothetical protein BCL76_1237 [Streptomyces sp. CG 926]|nr:hypothetical protein BCL76_1237 [Streptomyces sp. CG 926]